MAVMAIYRRENVSAKVYNEYRERVPIDRVPRGALAHFYGRTETGFVSVDVWEDETAMRRFIDGKIRPACKAMGVSFEEPEVIALETIVTTSDTSHYRVPFERTTSANSGSHAGVALPN